MTSTLLIALARRFLWGEPAGLSIRDYIQYSCPNALDHIDLFGFIASGAFQRIPLLYHLLSVQFVGLVVSRQRSFFVSFGGLVAEL